MTGGIQAWEGRHPELDPPPLGPGRVEPGPPEIPARSPAPLRQRCQKRATKTRTPPPAICMVNGDVQVLFRDLLQGHPASPGGLTVTS